MEAIFIKTFFKRNILLLWSDDGQKMLLKLLLMYGIIGYIYKEPQNLRLSSQLRTNEYGKYAGNNPRVNRHLQ